MAGGANGFGTGGVKLYTAQAGLPGSRKNGNVALME